MMKNDRLTQAVLLQIVFPAAFNKSLSQILLESRLLASLFKFLFDQSLLKDNIILSASDVDVLLLLPPI